MKGGKMFVWKWPVVIGVLSLAGLLAALIGDGWWDWASAVLLTVPTVLCAYYGFSKRSSKTVLHKQRRQR